MQNTTWQNLIPEGQAQDDFGFCGFYVRHFKDTSLQLIALNTNLYYRTNINTTYYHYIIYLIIANGRDDILLGSNLPRNLS